MKATYVHQSTMVGFWGEYPLYRGNCFSIMADNEKAYYVANMNLENLEHLIKHGKLNWPIEIYQLTDNHCLIVDERVPEDWYLPAERYCKGCYPVERRNEATSIQRNS